MKVIKQLDQGQRIRILTREELKLGVKVLTNNFDLLQGEQVLIITDEPFLKQEASVWFESAKTLTNKVELVVLDKVRQSGEEPPDEVLQCCAQAQVTLLHTSLSITHTKTRKAAHTHHNRCASLPMVDHAMMMRTLNIDYLPIQQTGKQLIQRLEQGIRIHIQSKAGTDLSAKVNTDRIINDDGILNIEGAFGNLPAGEIFWAPEREYVNGTWVIDGSLADFNLEESIEVTIENGITTHFKGGPQAEGLKQKLLSVGQDGLKVAEIGIGTNPMANPKAVLIEAEKAYGTAHLAFGNNAGYGGDNHVQIHLDGVTLYPKIELDGEVIVEEGRIL